MITAPSPTPSAPSVSRYTIQRSSVSPWDTGSYRRSSFQRAACVTGSRDTPSRTQASQPLRDLTEQAGEGGETLVREQTGNRSLVLFDSGNEVTVQAGENGIRFLLVSGKPIEEPVAWYGPIVMNTQAELNQAVSELRNGTFIKK